jgi:hypothetical protein
MSQPSVFLVQPRELPAILRDHGFTLIDVHADAGNNTYYVAETNRNAETIVVKFPSCKLGAGVNCCYLQSLPQPTPFGPAA